MIVDTRVLPTDSVMLSQLPPLAVDSMTQIQLTELIPQLVTLATGRQHPLFGKSQYRPDWWPDDVTWSWPSSEEDIKSEEVRMEMLRKIVKNCYKHLDQENLLTDASLPQGKSVQKSPGRVLSEHDGNQCAVSPQENTKNVQEYSEDNTAEDSPGFSPIWLCFLCAKQFDDQESLMAHQEDCEKEEHTENLQVPAVQTHSSAIPHPVPHTLVVRRRRRRFRPEVYIPPPKDIFIKHLYLKEKPKDNSEPIVKEEHADSDCEIIDVEMVETPVTPRTPKSLMSQLSRDSEGSHKKRHLSFSGHLAQSDSDSNGETSKDVKPMPAISSLLFNIDLSSALGHRVKKHLKIDSSIPIITKAETYCCGHEKNNFFDKLRQRDAVYPVSFKMKRKYERFCHRYKFSKSQRREFMITLKTGLNCRSRKLLRNMHPCKVKLEHLDPDVIREWLRPKPKPVICNPYQQPRYTPNIFSRLNVNAANFQTHAFRNAVEKPLVGPLSAKIRQMNQSLANLSRVNAVPRSYMITQLVKNPDGTETMRIVCDEKNIPKQPLYMSQQAAAAASRRKQNFYSDRLARSDNEIEIIDLSSSDEESEPVKQVQRPQKPVRRANILSKVFRPSGSFQPRASGSGSPVKPGISPSHPYVHLPTSNPKGFSIHSSPPGARTCKELLQRPVSMAGGDSRIIAAGEIGKNVMNNSNTGLRISNVYSVQDKRLSEPSRTFTTMRLQGPSVTPNGLQRPVGSNPQVGEPGRPKHMPANPMRGPKPVPHVPVKTSIHKMEVTGKNNDKEVVDVICIDDD